MVSFRGFVMSCFVVVVICIALCCCITVLVLYASSCVIALWYCVLVFHCEVVLLVVWCIVFYVVLVCHCVM